MLGWLANNYLERMWKEAIVARFEVVPTRHRERKATETSVRIADVPERWTLYLRNTEQESWPFDRNIRRVSMWRNANTQHLSTPSWTGGHARTGLDTLSNCFSVDRNLICLTIETEHKSRRALSAAAPGHVTTQQASGNCDINGC